MVKEEDETRVIITLIDHSAEVEYNKARTEKLIMSMVNATISHELRNPINSIHGQNTTIEMQLKQLDQLLQE